MPRIAYVLIATVALVAAATFGIACLLPLPQPEWSWWGAGLLLGAVLLAEAGAVEITRELDPKAQAGYALSIATIPHLFAALLLPAWGAMLLGGLGMLIDEGRARSPWPKLVFNVSSTMTSLGMASIAAGQLGIAGDQLGGGDWRQVLALLFVGLLYYTCNAAPVAAIGSIVRGGSFVALLVQNARNSAAAEFAMAIIGGMAAFLWVKQPYWLLAGLFPAAISQLTFRLIAAHNRKVAQFSALDRLGRLLSAELSLEEVFRAASAHLSQSRGVDGCFLVMPTVEFFHGSADSDAARAAGRGLIERVAATGAAVRVHDALDDPPLASLEPAVARSWVVMAIGGGSDQTCYFGILAELAEAFSADDVEFFGLVAERVALALQVAQRRSDLVRMAYHDALTGLPNRAYLLERVQHVLTGAPVAARDRPAVLLLDLDNFKVINDSLGHQVGDGLLRAVADLLLESVRPSDTVARLGGDEFIILLPDTAGVDGATTVAERIALRLRVPIQVGEHDIVVSTSIGVALSQPDDKPEALLRAADLALYQAKANGRSQYAFFDPAMESRIVERLELETALRQALERDELRVYYQPIVRLATSDIVGWEALVRWHHPQRGLVPPGAFVPLAEETGMIVPIGELVMREACRQLRLWQVAAADSGLYMSVNVSGVQFQQAGLVAATDACIRDTGLAPRCLKLEITESAIMGDAATAMRTLRALKELGVQLSIDDFGTGYSSLSYLKRFPVDTLKIDRSFVDGLSHDPQDTAIVRSIVALATAMGLDVTAEGIETQAQHAQLNRLACEYGQGYLFAKPLPAEGAEAMLLDASREMPAA